MSEGPTGADVQRARAAGEGHVRHTPVLSSRTLSERAGGTVALKAENLQRTGSFKLRGALAKIAALGDEGCARGVVAGSAGNHAQSVAYAARARGVPCEVFMPRDASIGKTESAEGLGATVHRVDGSVDDCVAHARERAERDGLAFIHPFDDPDIVAGQATLGLELLEDVPDLAKVVVPVGGGGLAAGIALAVKGARPDVEVVGVRIEDTGSTIADGIAIKQLGELTGALLDRWLDGTARVADDAVAAAMVILMERAKLVVEGAGAVGVAALLAGAVTPAAEGTTVAVLSGGNVDAGLLAAVARRHESEAGRRLVLLTRISDRPGGLAALLACIAEAGASVVDVSHVREGLDLHVRETVVELVLETRGHAHAEEVLAAIAGAGYAAEVLG